MKLDKPLRLSFDAETKADVSDIHTGVKDSPPDAVIEALKNEVGGLKEELRRVKGEKVQLEKKLNEGTKKETNYSGDAQIDGFLSDLAPFFFNKQITYVDVGAYTGEVFQKISESEHIKVREAHLFEPNPESYQKLKDRVEGMMGFHSIHANNFALSDSDCDANFVAANAMTKMMEESDESLAGTDTFQCRVKPFSSQLERITDGHIHLLKIDVEGSELKVLKGARAVLEAQAIDVIYIEVGFNIQGTQQTYIAEIDTFLQRCEYRAFKIYEQKNEWIEDLPWLRRCNIAYMSRRFSEANPYKLTVELTRLRKEIERLRK